MVDTAVVESNNAAYTATMRSSESATNGDNVGGDNDNDETLRKALQTEEHAVFRECIYALQGMSGQRLKFYRVHQEAIDVEGRLTTEPEKQVTTYELARSLVWGFRVDDYVKKMERVYPTDYRMTSLLGSGAHDAIYKCGAAGSLFLQIQTYIQCQTYQSSSVVRAFACALTRELHTYQSTIATKTPLFRSLREMLVLMDASIARLRTLALIVSTMPSGADDAASWTSAATDLLTRLHRHAHHGDSYMHVPLVTSLLQAASEPWFHMLYLWTIEGRLLETLPCEFMITTAVSTPRSQPYNRSSTTGTVSPRNLWRGGYCLHLDQVPVGVLSSDLVDLVFMVGKGVNFIRHCLQDAHWSLLELELTPEQRSSPKLRTHRLAELGYAYDTTLLVGRQRTSASSATMRNQHVLRMTLQRSATRIHAHILKSLHEQHFLLSHLYALKQFLLMGQGDFFSALLDGLHTAYGHYADEAVVGVLGGIHQHSLAAIAESAMRTTNAANFPPHILERLTVRMRLASDGTPTTDGTTSLTRSVWDIFMLDYSVPDPIAAIVHSEALESYRTMFLVLFQLNKVEYLLDYTWRQSSVLQRALHTNAQHLVIQTSTDRAYAQAIILLRQVAMTRQAMVHFVVNMKSYLMSEVLEGSWKRLIPSIEQAGSLDDVIHAHDQYLQNICCQSFLPTKTAILIRNELDLAGKLDRLLLLAGQFCSYQQGLFGDALKAADRAAQKRREAEELMHQGSWGFNRQREAAEQESCFGLSDATKLDELDELSQAFQSIMTLFLSALDSELNGSPATAACDRSNEAKETQNETDDRVQDLDSLRFLASQLTHNNFYGAMNF